MFQNVLLRLMLHGERMHVDGWIELLASEGFTPKQGNWMFGRPTDQAFMVSDGQWREITPAGRDWAWVGVAHGLTRAYSGCEHESDAPAACA